MYRCSDFNSSVSLSAPLALTSILTPSLSCIQVARSVLMHSLLAGTRHFAWTSLTSRSSRLSTSLETKHTLWVEPHYGIVLVSIATLWVAIYIRLLWESEQDLFPHIPLSPQGGNDYEIFEDARTIGHRVTNPEDTRRQLEELFK